MRTKEGKKLLVDLDARSLGDAETAGIVGSGKVELKVALRWILRRCDFSGCSITVWFVHAIDPDDWSSSRGELSQQVWERVYEFQRVQRKMIDSNYKA